MASNRKYAGLPDLDLAPDVYETPEAAEAGLGKGETNEPRSEPTDSEEEDSEDETSGISRNRLDPDSARSQFVTSRVDAREANFSDRIDGHRRSYRVVNGSRLHDDEEEELDEESRLKRHNLLKRANQLSQLMEELKSDVEKSKETGKWRDMSLEEEDAEDDDALTKINEAVTWLHLTDRGPESATARMQRRVASYPDRGPLKLRSESEAPFPPRIPDQRTSYTQISSPQAMALYSSLSSRLEQLESVLGLNSIPPPDLPSVKDFAMPLIPMTNVMQRQLNLLNDADDSFLEDLGKRIRSLTAEAERLDEQRKEARKSYEELRSTIDAGTTTPGTGNSNGFPPISMPRSPTLSGTTRMPGVDADARTLPLDPSHPLTHPDLPARISALHSTLPAIENLAPLLPPTLERLRALRQVHQDSAAANTRLEELEEHEAEMRADLGSWKETLVRMEEHLKKMEGSWMTNMDTVNAWVKDLEARVKTLGQS